MSIGKVFAILGLFFFSTIGFLVVSAAGFHNNEVGLRNAFNNKIEANTTDFDNMWKTISQVAQVPEMHKQGFQETFVKYAEARSSGKGEGGSLMQWVQEAVPQGLPTELYAKIQTTVEAKREGWTMRQKELIDIKQAHDNLITQFPGVIYATLMGRSALELKLVTSSRTQRAFETGADDNVDLIGQKSE